MKIKETIILIISIITISLSIYESCDDITALKNAHELKAKTTSFRQFPKLKIFSRIDSVLYRLNFAKFNDDTKKKNNGSIKSLSAQYFLELNFTNKLLNIGSNTAIVCGISAYYDTTYQSSFEKIKTKITQQNFDTKIENKLKFIDPGRYDYIKIGDTISYLKDQTIWFNLVIIYKNSASLYYYKYQAIKLNFEKFNIPVDYMNEMRKVATSILLGKKYTRIIDKIENSEPISKSDLKFFNF